MSDGSPAPLTVTTFVGATGDLSGAHAIRQEVFTGEQGISADLDADGQDAAAIHAVAERGGQVIGTGRVLLDDAGTGRVGRMAVRATERGGSVGGRLLRALEIAARRAGADRIVLHAQRSAAGFYHRAGYLPVGAPFVEAGIDHQEMTKALPTIRPVTDADGSALIDLIGGCFAEYPGCVLDVDAEEPWLRAPARTYAAAAGAMWVVAPRSGEPVVACGGFKPGERVAELKSLYVAAPYRRLGLASDLTALIEQAARRHGRREIELWTDTRFTDAHRMYERLGYQRQPGTRDLHDLSDTTEYHYRKPLG